MKRDMPSGIRGFILAGVGAGAFAVPALAGTTNDELANEVRALKETVKQQQVELQTLRNEKGEVWMNERRAEEVKALVREVLSDADTRASLAGDGLSAGYKSGFYIDSEDGSFRLKINGMIQARYLANFRDNAPTASGPAYSDDEQGFQIRRARLVFSGHVGSPKVEYTLQTTANRDSGVLELEKAELAYALTDTIKIGGGRYKEHFLREETISSSRQMAVERSLVNGVFTASYVEGIYGIVDATEWLRLTASLSDGLRSGAPGGTSPAGFLNGGNDFANDAAELGFTLRGDAKLAGDWKQADEFAAWSKDKTAVFVGAAVHYELAKTGDRQAAGTTPISGAYDDFFTYTVDGLVKSGGLSLYAAGIGNHIHAIDTVARGDLNNFGVIAQASYFIIPDKFEPFARYEWLHVDEKIAGAEELNIITVGANYHIKPKVVKATVDVVYALQPVTAASTLGATTAAGGSAGTGLSGGGLLADTAGTDDGQVVLRGQVQLTF